MYAVVSTGGKQYRVEPGSTLRIERVPAQAGATLTFDRVLLVGDGDEVTVGTPVVAGASVSATVLGEDLGPKLVIFKFKQKVKYRRRTGHRQHLMRVRIDAITADGRTTAREEPKVEPKRKAAPKPKVAPKAEAAVAAEPEAGAEPKAGAEPEAKPKPKPRARVAPKPSAKASAAAEPKAARPRAGKAKASDNAGDGGAEAAPSEKPKPRRRTPKAKAEE